MKEQLIVYSPETFISTTRKITTGTKAGIFIIDVTTAIGSTLVVTIQAEDPISGKTWDILETASIATTGTTVLRVHPELTASANLIAKDILPQGINVKLVVTGFTVGSISYLGVE
jgi:hypothetical protein